MARTSKTVDIGTEMTAVQKMSLKDMGGEAVKLANQPSVGTLQTRLALMAYYGQKKALAAKNAKWDFNLEIFVPFCSNYYHPDFGGNRAELKGFKANGTHEPKSSALSLLRGYTHFADAAKSTKDMEPVIRAILSAKDIATKGITVKGSLLSSVIEDAKGAVPTAKAIADAVDKKANPAEPTTNPVVTAAKSLRSRIAALLAEEEFKAGLNPTTAPLFNAIAESVVAFAMAAIGTKTGKPGAAEKTANDTLIANAAALVAAPVKAARKRAGS